MIQKPTVVVGAGQPVFSRYVAEPVFVLVNKKVDLKSITCSKFSTAKDLTQP
jgi:hypothetical protein